MQASSVAIDAIGPLQGILLALALMQYLACAQLSYA